MKIDPQFLVEITELSRKYRVLINGCGCCGSPSLEALPASGKYYKMKDGSGYGELKWFESDKDVEWAKDDIEVGL